MMLGRVNKVFRKGTDAEFDGSSGFFDQDHRRATGLGDFLKEKRVSDVYVLGLPTEFGVKFTTLDAVALGFRTHLIEDACRGMDRTPNAVTEALAAMKKAGVRMTRSRDVLAPAGKS